jgi:hypothetical protein
MAGVLDFFRRAGQHHGDEGRVPLADAVGGAGHALLEGQPVQPPGVEAHAQLVLGAPAGPSWEPLVQFPANGVLELVLH